MYGSKKDRNKKNNIAKRKYIRSRNSTRYRGYWSRKSKANSQLSKWKSKDKKYANKYTRYI